MTDSSLGRRLVLAFARLTLALHPKAFRRRWGDEYLEAAEQRWRSEAARAARGSTVRSLVVLARDAAGSVPIEWRDEWRGRQTPRALEPSAEGGAVTAWVEGLWWDARIGVRSLTRRPGLSILVVGTLALGVGANASIYQALNNVVLNPLSFPGSDRAVFVMSRDPQRGFTFSVTQERYERWREGARSFEDLEAFRDASALLIREGSAERLDGAEVSLGLAHLLGVTAVAGRLFTAGDAQTGAAPVVMVSEDYWRSRMGADPEVIGSTLRFDDLDRIVVGVWPRSGRFRIDEDPKFYMPLARGSEISRTSFSIVLGVLADDVDSRAAQSELEALAAGVDEEAADLSEETAVLPIHTFVSGDFVRALWILFWGVGLLLVVAGFNAANLLLNRAVERERELGVRMALGGPGARLLRHFVIEGLVLSGLGAFIGVATARLAGRALTRIAPPTMPTGALTGTDGRTIPYAILLVVGLTLVCGLVPALHIRSSAARELIGDRRGGASLDNRWLRTALIGTQIAVAALTVIGSGLAAKSLLRLRSIDFGFAIEELLVVTVRRPQGLYEDQAERRALTTRVRERLESLTSVRSVSASTAVLPLRYSVRFGSPYLDGEEPPSGDDGSVTETAGISGDFLGTMGIPVLEGRDFTADERDADGADVVLVNRAFADRYPGSVLGRSLRFPGDSVGRRIVGVVGDVRNRGSIRAPSARAQIYYPSHGVSEGRSQRYLVRTSSDDAGLAAAIRTRIREVDTGLLVPGISSGEDLVSEFIDDSRFLVVILGILAALSSVLALAGVYGAVALSVGRRTREIGIRIALGARAHAVVGSTVADGMRPVLLGLLAGLGLAYLLMTYLSDVLYEVSPRDPASFMVAALLLASAGVLAALLPARRAAQADPTETLRSE
jgi:putative ABC transport system permease protein